MVAKNYLTKDEIDTLNRLTIVFLETAELRVKERKDITLHFWRDNVDRILQFNDREVLKTAGSITHEQMEEHVKLVYEQFDKNRKDFEAKQADLDDLKQLESKLRKKG